MMGPPTCSLIVATLDPFEVDAIFSPPLDPFRRLEYNFTHLAMLHRALQVLPLELLLLCVGGCAFIQLWGARCPCIKKQPLRNPLPSSPQRLALFLVCVLTRSLCPAWNMLWKILA